MAGIFGIYNVNNLSNKVLSKTANILFKESLTRAKEICESVYCDTENNIYSKKSYQNNQSLKKEFQKLIKSSHNKNINILISQLNTSSEIDYSPNINLVSKLNKTLVAFDGIILNNETSLNANELINKNLAQFNNKIEAIETILKKTLGTLNLAVYDIEKGDFFLASNIGSLHYIINKTTGSLIFASEKIFLYKVVKLLRLKISDIKQVKPNKVLNFKSLKIENTGKEKLFDLSSKLKTIETPFINNLKNLEKHNFDNIKTNNIQYCKNCILPSSAPFIKFDEDGVCNYCTNHNKIKFKGFEALKEIADKHRKSNGEIDCIAAFSGGKDSSFGLYYLKNVLGLNPIAYTYDWGMMTEIGKRNQAKILQKLEIEHIIVSANHENKRKNIRKNILAWLKDPHPGIVPLFMQGDKQCEMFADKLKKKYNIDLMFYFRGNELEIDEFKAGLAGVDNPYPQGVLQNLVAYNKIKLLIFYISRYFRNPALFNKTLSESIIAFYSTYIQKHEYEFLWHLV